MRNIKLVLEYDGGRYNGWQWQPRAQTIQGELQRSLKSLLQEPAKVIAAGRTDTGVHALGQIATFKTESELSLSSVQMGLNSYLPADIRVLSAHEVDSSFHPRYDAVSRLYRYVISKRPRAVGRQYSWHCKYRLDVGSIREASRRLTGSHAFTAFSKINDDEPHYLCDVFSIVWQHDERRLCMEICANRFLHNMVRIIVGTMIEVGRGKLTPDDVAEILQRGDRKRAGSAAPPQGLFLVQVNY